MTDKASEILTLIAIMLLMFSPLILMLVRDKPSAFTRVHYPDTPDRALPEKLQDIDRLRREKKNSLI